LNSWRWVIGQPSTFRRSCPPGGRLAPQSFGKKDLTRQLGPGWARGSKPWPVRWQGDEEWR
jgi:hypothetical protein